MGTVWDAESALLGPLLGIAGQWGTFSNTPTIYVALTSAEVSDSDTGSTISDLSYSGYERVSYDSWVPLEYEQQSYFNNEPITFAEIPLVAGQQTVRGIAVVDASANGNVLCYKNILRAIAAEKQPEIPAGGLTISLLLSRRVAVRLASMSRIVWNFLG